MSGADGHLGSRFSDDARAHLGIAVLVRQRDRPLVPALQRRYADPARTPQVTVPTAVAVFPGDLGQPPREWAERRYAVQRYTVMPRGGHFAAWEEPDLLAEDVAAFFDELRRPPTTAHVGRNGAPTM